MALILTILSPAVWVSVLGNGEAVFPYTSPAIFSIPIAFFTIWLVSILDRSKRAAKDKAGFLEQHGRSETGIGAGAVAAH
ncbi:MAG: hypothetical protein ABIT04_00595 [Novosphingobium sp.]